MNRRRWYGFFMSVLLSAAGLFISKAVDVKAEELAAGGSSTTYEVFVYSFYDSDGDGIGDLRGLLEKLDYINDGDPVSAQDLSCDMLWTMPVFPSPTYHKYDVTDYCAIDPVYGSMEDFDELLQACHARGMRWILDLPVNHTSCEHPWFQAAADYLMSLPEGEEPSAQACPYVDYYHFSREPSQGWALLDGSSWYYEAQFWEGMPDLNLDSETVREEIAEILAFWLDRGVDGFRLDAVTSFYTHDLEKSISFLKWLCDTAKEIRPDCYLVGEAWADQDTYTSFYASGIDSMFDFAFSGAEGVVARTANGKKSAAWYGEKLVEGEQKREAYPGAVNAPFYTNHDMARGAGYYTRDDGGKTKLALALNLLMSGNVYLYYGEELGMKGSGKDENKRAPMYWDADPQAEGMCSGPEEMDEVKMKFPSCAEQTGDDTSILSYVRYMIRLRESFPSIAKGRTTLLPELSGKEVCAICKELEGEIPVLILINTSAEEQRVELASSEESRNDPVLFGEVSPYGEKCSADEEGKSILLPAFGIAVLEGEK